MAGFEARVRLCDAATIRDSIRLHVANIISSLDKCDIAYIIDHRDQGDESMTVLKGLFRGKPELATDESLSTFMGFPKSAKSSKSEDQIYEQCIAWAQELCEVVTTKIEDGIFAANVDNLWAKLAPYADFNEQFSLASSPLSFNPSLLVDRIEITGDFRLKYSIGDCPGLGDVNKDRETKANRYLRECQAVVVVEEISRAGDSQFLADFLDGCRKRRSHQRVIVALSKSEANINLVNHVNVAFKAHELEELDYLANRKQELTENRKALGVRDHAGRDKIDNHIRFIELEEIDIVARERGRRIGAKLMQKYSQPDNKLTVLSISAMDYMRHVEGYDKNDKPKLLLSVQSTNIPKLVSQLADIPNYRLEKNLLQLQKQILPDLLDHVDYLCSMTEVKAHAGIKFNFDFHEERFREQLNTLLDEFEEKHINALTKTIKIHIPEWKSDAERLFKGWRKLHGTTIMAFMRKYGNHRTKKSRGPSWNTKLLDAPQNTLDPMFNSLVEEALKFNEQRKEGMAEGMNALMQDMRHTIKGIDNEAFKRKLENMEPELHRKLSQVGARMPRLLKLHKGRFLEDGNGDYFPSAMHSLYSLALAEQMFKQQTFRNSLDTLERFVCGTKSPYNDMLAKVTKVWNTVKSEQKRLGEAAIKKEMDEIRAAYKQLSAQQKPNESVLKMCANLTRLVKDGRHQCDGPIRTLLLECGLGLTVKMEEE